MIEIIVPGRPVPYTRMTQRSKYVSKSAQRYLAYKDQVGYITRTVLRGFRYEKDLPLIIDVEAHLWGKITLMGMDGDTSNYVKAAEDALNKIAFYDDRQIRKSMGEKFPVEQKKDEKLIIRLKEYTKENRNI